MMTPISTCLAALAFAAVAAAIPSPHHAPDPLLKAIENPQVPHEEADISGLSPPSSEIKTPEQPQLSGPVNPAIGVGLNRRKRTHCWKCGGGGGGYGGSGYGGGWGGGGGGYSQPAKIIVVPIISGGGGKGYGGGGCGGSGCGGGGYDHKPSGGCQGGCGGGGYPSGSWSQSSASSQASSSSGSWGKRK